MQNQPANKREVLCSLDGNANSPLFLKWGETPSSPDLRPLEIQGSTGSRPPELLLMKPVLIIAPACAMRDRRANNADDVKLIQYLTNLSKGRLILWCYFIWYLVVLVRYFDPSPRLWLTSLGLSLIIGFALFVSTTAAGKKEVKLDRWQIIRLFMMPFCVSSFSALVKGKGFVLIFSPDPKEILLAVGLCVLLCGTAALLKKRQQNASGAFAGSKTQISQ